MVAQQEVGYLVGHQVRYLTPYHDPSTKIASHVGIRVVEWQLGNDVQQVDIWLSRYKKLG